MQDTNFAKNRTAIIKDIIQLTRSKYVYPEMGEKIASEIEAKLDAGSYNNVGDENELSIRLTSDLQTISNDHHWSITYDPKGVASQVDPEHEEDEERLMQYIEMARKTNFGFKKVEVFRGNIGYIDLRHFYPSEHGGETAVSVMNSVANCDALIIDLRQNNGGYPSMVQLIISYLINPEPQHINTFYYRPTDTIQQFWTFPYVPGKRRADIPVYVLTSHDTGSAAEEFAYDLKAMGRATLIGETTFGAAHPVTKEVVQKDFVVRLPYGRPINPITGSNWDGTGVEPDLICPAEEALKIAHLEALKEYTAKCQDENEMHDLAWMAEIIESDYTPIVIAEIDLGRCVGEFGQRRFLIGSRGLIYQNQALQLSWDLISMNKTRFRLDEDMIFEFTLDQGGKASAVKIEYRDRRPAVVVNRTQ
jgi:hypothetical protein